MGERAQRALGRLIAAATTPVLGATIWRRWLADELAVVKSLPSGEHRWRHDWEIQEKTGLSRARVLRALRRMEPGGWVEQGGNPVLWRLREPFDLVEHPHGEET